MRWEAVTFLLSLTSGSRNISAAEIICPLVRVNGYREGSEAVAIRPRTRYQLIVVSGIGKEHSPQPSLYDFDQAGKSTDSWASKERSQLPASIPSAPE